MGRTVLAVVAGLLVMAAVVFAIEAIGHWVYPRTPGVDLSDPEAMRDLIGSLPVMAQAFVVLAWAAGSFVGAWVAVKIAHTHRRGAALSIGVVMIVLVAITVSGIPHPAWMIAAGLLLPIPLALAALHLARG